MKNDILVFINNSWGEVEWILPVCGYIKRNYPRVKVSVLINAIDKEQIFKGNNPLYELLVENTDKVYCYYDFLPWFYRILYRILCKIPFCRSFIKEYFFGFMKLSVTPKVIRLIQPAVLLKDVEPEVKVRKKIVIEMRKIGCRDIMFPHSSFFTTKEMETRPDFVAHDILCTTEEMRKIFPPCDKENLNLTHTVGIPKYDEWWIQYLKEHHHNGINKHPLFLFLTRGPHATSLFNEETADELFHEAMNIMLSYTGSFIIIKPHPRQDLKKLQKNLSTYDMRRFMIDQSSSMYLPMIADVVISMGKSAALIDSLVVGKPAIEYYKYTDIKYDPEYLELGLVSFAISTIELKEQIDERINENISESYINNLKKIIHLYYDDSTKKATKIIINELYNEYVNMETRT